MKGLVAHLKAKLRLCSDRYAASRPGHRFTIVAGLADKTIFVVRWASTARDMVQTLVQKLSVQKRVGGIVLNLVVADRAKKYGSDTYGGSLLRKVLFRIVVSGRSAALRRVHVRHCRCLCFQRGRAACQYGGHFTAERMAAPSRPRWRGAVVVRRSSHRAWGTGV